MTPESTSDDFKAYQICFRFFSRVYFEPPSKDFLSRLANRKALEFWPLSVDGEPDSEGLKRLKDCVKRWRPSELHRLQSDYDRLFIGPQTSLAPPFASVYLGRESLIFDDQTLEVRSVYRKFGLEIEDKHRVPDDHLGFELEFLSQLCGRCVSLIEENRRLVKPVLVGLDEFLSRNLFPWVFDFLPRMRQGAETPYYKGIADLTGETIMSFNSFLERCLSDRED